jgi:hypothetical protein
MNDNKDDEDKNSEKGPQDEPSGKAKGGIARRDALSPEQRRMIATKAATARWGAKPFRATHRGSFKEDFGIDVDCYVLDDAQKSAVISQRGMGATLGLGQSGGNLLPRFLAGEKIAPHVGDELREKIGNPLVFQWTPPATNASPPATVYGYDVTILIDVCKAIIAAADAGKLLKRQEHIAKQAHVILNASAKAGIRGLVYALAGYDQTREEAIEAFKFYVREEAREYEREFPAQLYEAWYRLYAIPKPARGKTWKFKHLTVDQVYWPLARSSGKILELTKALKAQSEDRYAKLHQFLSETGVKALRTHLGRLLGMADTSQTKEEYEAHVERIFGNQTTLDFNRT